MSGILGIGNFGRGPGGTAARVRAGQGGRRMEIIDAAELTRGRGERTVQVAHSDTGLTRGLDHGEAVLLRVEDGEYHVARVTDIGFEPDDTVYTFELGGRVPGDLARERAEGLSPERHDLEL